MRICWSCKGRSHFAACVLAHSFARRVLAPPTDEEDQLCLCEACWSAWWGVELLFDSHLRERHVIPVARLYEVANDLVDIIIAEGNDRAGLAATITELNEENRRLREELESLRNGAAGSNASGSAGNQGQSRGD